MCRGTPSEAVMTFEKPTPTTRPAVAPSSVKSSASVMNSLKTSRPEAPIAILTPTSRTRSFSVAIWMLTLTMPPPMSARIPESRKIMS